VPPAFAEVLTLGAGEISKPIASSSGWHIVKVTEIKPKRRQPFDEVRDKATARATFEKQQGAQKYWLQKLRASAKIVYHDAAIRQFVKANQFDANAAPPQHSLQ
jgi:peptidyl-prolyl cis-trans isomerase D